MFVEQKFRMNAWILGSVLSVVTIAIIQAILLAGHRGLLPLHEILFTLAAIWGFSFLFWFFFPTYVGKDGLRATDGVGRFHNVPWDEMQKVSSVFGFYWLHHGKTGKALCFPKFLVEAQRFRDAVRTNAPEGNSFRAYLGR